MADQPWWIARGTRVTQQEAMRLPRRASDGEIAATADLLPLVEPRYFAGLTPEDAADVLSISRATAWEEWRMARACLHRQLKDLKP
ncbi:MAG: ECF-type sigma factor [Phycisphaerales bacterium]|nr:ECF-type sigma factor [Phycisphaerales bacterium]